ncbi:orotate phosphoribosyltransferase [Alkalibacillus almallahensis]|uniref:orotate phosphoribosyltransferase n=1 Tax=Alkalibacillus almallahensis TaxID=1379154 RepID=UPI0014228E9E|nr:orotate phosphoribosyltransferase [Alkalibacillus almallahensis]NIK10726.1 orotate phosphoribosyltransferase [Alkalibacillus almallahensis]
MPQQTIAEQLIQIEAIKINMNERFTWSSGITSPVYCDNRLTMSYPQVRRQIAGQLANQIDRSQVDVIAGCATAGIPHAAFTAELLDLPMIYVRSKPKGHGLENMIEGRVDSGDRVVVIEDLISTGQSATKVVEALREKGCEVLYVLSIFTYGLDVAEEQFNQKGIINTSLVTFDEIANLLRDKGEINQNEYNALLEWRDNLILTSSES